MLEFLIVFALTTVSDAVWTYYIQASSSRQTAKAVLASGVIVLVGSLVTLEIVEDRWMLVPTVLGAMTGTLITMLVSNGRARRRNAAEAVVEAAP